LYELVAEVVLKKGISEAVSVLSTIFGDSELSADGSGCVLGAVLANVLNGGLPFHDFDFEEFLGEDWINVFGGQHLNQFTVLDYMKTKNYDDMSENNLRSTGSYGNHNWLLW
jgi:hypothetical protein